MNLSKIALTFGFVAFGKAFADVQGLTTCEQALVVDECSDGLGVPVILSESFTSKVSNITTLEDQPTRVHQAIPNIESSNNSPGAVFKTWGQEQINYRGLCDLVLLENPGFHNGVGMDIHIRTKQTEQQWTYTSNAVLRIGKETLEVMGSKGGRSQYWISGMVGEEFGDEKSNQVAHISGYPIHFRRLNNQQDEFTVDLGKNETIVMKTWNDIVRVKIHGERAESFVDRRGAMGEFGSGKYMARDNITELKSQNALVQEWQVHSQLFYNLERSPQSCMVSSSSTEIKQPLKKLVTQSEAESACSLVRQSHHDMCVFDVMATNDLGMASAY